MESREGVRLWWWMFRAEWKKMTGNRWLSGCLIWSWAGAVCLLSLVLTLLVAISPDARDRFTENPYKWTDASVFFWAIPNSIIGRLLVIGFAAALFGGEYQWGTWKNLLPRQGRVKLILVKFLTLAAFVLVAFGLTSIIWVIGMGIVQTVAGGGYPPALDAVPSGYWTELWIQVTTAFLSTLILAAIAALAALVTRSSLGSVMVGVVAAFMDGFVAAALIVFYWFTDWRLFPSLYRFTISYNVDNLLGWATNGRASEVLGNVHVQDNPVFGEITIDPPIAGNPLGISLIILLVWMSVLMGLAVYSFYRQDLTS